MLDKLLDKLNKINTETAGFKTYSGVVIIIMASVLNSHQIIDTQAYAALFSVGVGLAVYGRYFAGRKEAE